VPAFVLPQLRLHEVLSYGVLTCATVNDIIAVVRPGQGRAIALLAHYDSVPAGPGAADDESGVATVIETVRALQARGLGSRHPILAVLDGTARKQASWARRHSCTSRRYGTRVGAVVNVEARGNQGPSLLFQTSPGDGPLIDLYANKVPDYATSSVYAEIYSFPAERYGPPRCSFATESRRSIFAFAGNIADYHTALDRRANLDPVSLQQQGNNMLGVASGLEQADFGGCAVVTPFFSIFSAARFRACLRSGPPLSLLAVALLACCIAACGTRTDFLVTMALCVCNHGPRSFSSERGSGFALHGVAALVSGTPDPSYAYPAALRIALALSLAARLCLSRDLRFHPPLQAPAWLWIATLGIVVAIFLPGLSAYFLFPAGAAAILLFAAARIPGVGTVPLARSRFFAARL